MHASKRTVKIVRHEWTLPSPAHHTEVAKAVDAALREHQAVKHPTSDVMVRAEDDLVVIGFEAEQPKVATRGGDTVMERAAR